MDRKDWVQILVGVVILGTLGWLATTVFDLNGTIQAIDGRSTNNEERVERIAQALPEMGRRIAFEELTNPIRTAVITTNPFRTPTGSLVASISIVDIENKERLTYQIDLAEGSEPIILALKGSAYDSERSLATFAEMNDWSYEMNEQLAGIPLYIDQDSSFVLRSTSAEDYNSRLTWMSTAPVKSNIDSDYLTWAGLILDIQDNSPSYEPIGAIPIP